VHEGHQQLLGDAALRAVPPRKRAVDPFGQVRKQWCFVHEVSLARTQMPNPTVLRARSIIGSHTGAEPDSTSCTKYGARERTARESARRAGTRHSALRRPLRGR